MNKKFIGIFIIFLIVVIIVLYLNIKDTESNKINKQIVDKSKPIEISKEIQPIQIDTASKSVEVDDSNQQTLQFHQDPVLDYRIALSKFNNCIQYFNPLKSFGPIKFTEQKLTKKQKKVVDHYNDYCESIKHKYPYYFSKDGLSGLSQADPNMQNFSDLNDFSEDKMIKFVRSMQDQPLKFTEPDIFDIGSASAYSVIGAHQSLKTIFDDKVYPELKAIIGGNDQNYLTKIVAFAENKIACNLGADCSANSNMMVNYCRIDESNCGLSFNQMYETRLSTGQQLDVVAAINYLKTIFGL